MAVAAPTRSFLMRPNIELKIDGQGADVIVDTDAIGRFDLSTRDTDLLHDLLDVAKQTHQETELLESIHDRGHGMPEAVAILDMLVGNGIAVRYGAAISSAKAAHIGAWTSHIDRVVAWLKASSVLLVGKAGIRSPLADELAAWGMPVRVQDGVLSSDGISSALSASLPSLVASLDQDAPTLESLASWCDRFQIPLLPVRMTDGVWVVGPLFVSGVSPCPCCASTLDSLVRRQVRDALASDRKPVIDLVTALTVDCLGRRSDAEALFQSHAFGPDGWWQGTYPSYGHPRCRVCSRLNRFPENAVIHG